MCWWSLHSSQRHSRCHSHGRITERMRQRLSQLFAWLPELVWIAVFRPMNRLQRRLPSGLSSRLVLNMSFESRFGMPAFAALPDPDRTLHMFRYVPQTETEYMSTPWTPSSASVSKPVLLSTSIPAGLSRNYGLRCAGTTGCCNATGRS